LSVRKRELPKPPEPVSCPPIPVLCPPISDSIVCLPTSRRDAMLPDLRVPPNSRIAAGRRGSTVAGRAGRGIHLPQYAIPAEREAAWRRWPEPTGYPRPGGGNGALEPPGLPGPHRKQGPRAAPLWEKARPSDRLTVPISTSRCLQPVAPFRSIFRTAVRQRRFVGTRVLPPGGVVRPRNDLRISVLLTLGVTPCSRSA